MSIEFPSSQSRDFNITINCRKFELIRESMSHVGISRSDIPSQVPELTPISCVLKKRALLNLYWYSDFLVVSHKDENYAS